MSDNTELPGAQEPVPQPGLKFLEFAVYTMGGLLVLMFLGLIGGIVWKVTHRAPPLPPVTQQLSLGLAPGSEVKSTVIDGDRLVITTGSEIVVVDLRRNAILSRLALTAK